MPEFLIDGVERTTGKAVKRRYRSSTSDEAVKAAGQDGLAVQQCRKDPGPPEVPSHLKPYVSHHPKKKTAERPYLLLLIFGRAIAVISGIVLAGCLIGWFMLIVTGGGGSPEAFREGLAQLFQTTIFSALFCALGIALQAFRDMVIAVTTNQPGEYSSADEASGNQSS